MSDQSQGQGWWQASDGRWYPPEQWTGPLEDQPQATEIIAPVVPPPYTGPSTAAVPPVYAAVPAATVAPAGVGATPGNGPATTAVPWFHTWWAIIPLLLLCWPVALLLLWTSPQSRMAKITATAVTIAAFGVFLAIGALAEPVENEVVASNDPTTTTELTTTTQRPSTTTTPATTSAPTTAAPTTTAPPPTTAAPTTAPPPTAPPLSPSQTNARRSAVSYLDYQSFSRSGLIEQLEYEGFPRADAEWAVDDVSPDWNEQAAKSAASYLEYQAFSRSGLVEQLVYEGFTQQQAEYGVSTTGL